MNGELISEIYKSKESYSYRNYLESNKIQGTYWRKFIEEFSRLIDRCNEEHEEEHKSFIKLKEMIDSEAFKNLLGNDKYRKKADGIITRENLVVGKSQTKLLNIYQELSKLCCNYEKEYESFIADTEKRMRSDLYKFDTDSKVIFENVFSTKICTESFFNALSNNKMI